jgi:hypothetical protein
VRFVTLFLGAALLLAGCATPEAAPEPTATASVTQEPTETAEATSESEPTETAEATSESEPTETAEATSESDPTVSLEELRGLINEVPRPDLESLRQHFLLIDNGAQGLEPFPIEYQIGPTAVPEKVELVINRFSQKMKMFQLVGLESLDQDWVLASEKDYEWWVEYRSNQDPDFPLELWNAELKELGHCRLSPTVFCGAGNGVNGKNYQDNVVGTRFTDRGLDYVSRHEGAHFYQAVFGYGGRCWFAEGQATFFETYLETSSRSRSQVIQELLRSPSNIGDASEQELTDLVSRDAVCNPDYRVAYDLGMLAFEYLYMNFSFAQVHDLMVRSSVISWDEAVVEVLSVDPSELNRALSSYIYAQIQQ